MPLSASFKPISVTEVVPERLKGDPGWLQLQEEEEVEEEDEDEDEDERPSSDGKLTTSASFKITQVFVFYLKELS